MKNADQSSFLRHLFLVIIGLSLMVSSSANADEFDEVVNQFYDSPPRRVSREWFEQKVSQAEEIFRQFPNHPGSARVMYSLATYVQTAGYRSPEIAMQWYRRAAEHADPGSDYWFRAKYAIASQLGQDNLDEVEKVINEIASQATLDDSLNRITVESFRVSIAHQRGDYETALHHAHIVMDWYDRDWENNYPGDDNTQARIAIDGKIRGVASYVINSMYANNFSMTIGDRIVGIREVMRRQPLLRPVQESGRRVLGDLEAQLKREADRVLDQSMDDILDRGLDFASLDTGESSTANTNGSDTGLSRTETNRTRSLGTTEIQGTSTNNSGWLFLGWKWIAIAIGTVITILAGYFVYRKTQTTVDQ